MQESIYCNSQSQLCCCVGLTCMLHDLSRVGHSEGRCMTSAPPSASNQLQNPTFTQLCWSHALIAVATLAVSQLSTATTTLLQVLPTEPAHTYTDARGYTHGVATDTLGCDARPRYIHVSHAFFVFLAISVPIHLCVCSSQLLELVVE